MKRVDRTARANVPLEQIHLARELTALGRRADAHEQLVAKERLLHEVDRAELHRFDGGIDRAEAGHDDEDRIDMRLPQLSQHVEPGHPRHPHVGKDHVEAAVARDGEAFLAGRRRLDGISC